MSVLSLKVCRHCWNFWLLDVCMSICLCLCMCLSFVFAFVLICHRQCTLINIKTKEMPTLAKINSLSCCSPLPGCQCQPYLQRWNESHILIAFQHITLTLYIAKVTLNGLKKNPTKKLKSLHSKHPGLSLRVLPLLTRSHRYFSHLLWGVALCRARMYACTCQFVCHHPSHPPERPDDSAGCLSACLIWCRALTGSVGGPVSTWQSSRPRHRSPPPALHSSTHPSSFISSCCPTVDWIDRERCSNPVLHIWWNTTLNIFNWCDPHDTQIIFTGICAVEWTLLFLVIEFPYACRESISLESATSTESQELTAAPTVSPTLFSSVPTEPLLIYMRPHQNQ